MLPRYMTVGVVAAAFAVACFLPVWYCEGGFCEEGTEFYGLEVFLVGGLGIFQLKNLAWLANPLLLTAVILYLLKKDRTSWAVALLSFAFAISPLVDSIDTIPSLVRVTHPFAIVICQGLEWRIGYVVWAAIPLYLSAASALQAVLLKSQNPAPLRE